MYLKFGNHWPFHDFFALLISDLLNDYGVRRARDHAVEEKPKMARRQTETTYMRAVIQWLSAYWND
jgi:hypothetical protein